MAKQVIKIPDPVQTIISSVKPQEAVNPAPDHKQAQAEPTTGKSKVTPKKKITRNQHLQILITEGQRDKLRRIAEENGLSVNELINQAIDNFLDGID